MTHLEGKKDTFTPPRSLRKGELNLSAFRASSLMNNRLPGSLRETP